MKLELELCIENAFELFFYFALLVYYIRDVFWINYKKCFYTILKEEL